MHLRLASVPTIHSWIRAIVALGLLLLARNPLLAQEQGPSLKVQNRVRDRLWIWAHDVGVYNGNWGLKKDSHISPVEGASYLGITNVIFIRYLGKPAPPFENYFGPFRAMRQVYWSITGANGLTSQEERIQVLSLARQNTNVTGVFMDDFFHLTETASLPPQWLAQNHPPFPVYLTLLLPNPISATSLELQQSDWKTGDYRTRQVAVEISSGGTDWAEVARVELPNEGGTRRTVPLPSTTFRSLRVKIESTHDQTPGSAWSCGLKSIRLWDSRGEIRLNEARLEATSSYPGHEPESILPGAVEKQSTAPAALTVSELRELRQQLRLPDRQLNLGVTLYTYQLTPRVRSHLELCDTISLWTWKSEDLQALPQHFETLRSLAPGKRLLLGCYLYDFGNNRPIPLDRMKAQTEQGFRWLREGKIEGIIFLGSNLCDLGLEAVEWTRGWIRWFADTPLDLPKTR